MGKSLILLGNPGVGKGYILNKLGGNFDSRTSPNSVITKFPPQKVYIGEEWLTLIDLHGIEKFREDKKDDLKEAIDVIRSYSEIKVVFVITVDMNWVIRRTSKKLIKEFSERVNNRENIWFIVNKLKKRQYRELDKEKEEDVKRQIEEMNFTMNLKKTLWLNETEEEDSEGEEKNRKKIVEFIKRVPVMEKSFIEEIEAFLMSLNRTIKENCIIA